MCVCVYVYVYIDIYISIYIYKHNIYIYMYILCDMRSNQMRSILLDVARGWQRFRLIWPVD